MTNIQKKVDGVFFQNVFDEASRAAVEAVAKVANMENDPIGQACGFAWVDIYYSREKSLTKDFRNWAKKNGHGRASHKSGVWTFWNPGKHIGQSIWVIEHGATAFARVLKKYGINAYFCSRLD